MLRWTQTTLAALSYGKLLRDPSIQRSEILCLIKNWWRTGRPTSVAQTSTTTTTTTTTTTKNKKQQQQQQEQEQETRTNNDNDNNNNNNNHNDNHNHNHNNNNNDDDDDDDNNDEQFQEDPWPVAVLIFELVTGEASRLRLLAPEEELVQILGLLRSHMWPLPPVWHGGHMAWAVKAGRSLGAWCTPSERACMAGSTTAVTGCLCVTALKQWSSCGWKMFGYNGNSTTILFWKKPEADDNLECSLI